MQYLNFTSGTVEEPFAKLTKGRRLPKFGEWLCAPEHDLP
jgi:hypothetical protein